LPTGASQKTSGLVKNIIPIGPADHKSKEPFDLFIAKANVHTHIFLIRANLPIDYVTQPKSPGHSAARILFLKDLSWQVIVANDLKKLKSHQGLHLSGARLPFAQITVVLQHDPGL